MNAAMRPWNYLMGASVLAMLALLAFDLLVPLPTKEASARKLDSEAQKLREETFLLTEKANLARAKIDSRVWKETSDGVGAKTLELATRIAKSKGLNLTAFRPQKPIDEGELTRLSFVMTLEGPYPGLQGVVKELESPLHRLSVHLVQVASADEASDLINATVGVTAFVERPKAPPANKEIRT